MGLIAIKANPVSTTIPSAPKGFPIVANTQQTPVPQGQSSLNDAKALCEAFGGPNVDRLKKDLQKQKYDVSALKTLKTT